MLVIGQLSLPLLPDAMPSTNLQRARSYGVRVVSERQFLEWAGKAPASTEFRPYSADQLASLTGLSMAVIDQLTLCGLLDGREGRYRFRDLAAGRQLAALLTAGVGLSVITQTIREVARWLPDLELCELQLYPGTHDSILLQHLSGRTDKLGQFVLPLEHYADDPECLFEQAQGAEGARDVELAERLYRRVMRLDPDDSEAVFNLGNLLQSGGRYAEAEAAFRDRRFRPSHGSQKPGLI